MEKEFLAQIIKNHKVTVEDSLLEHSDKIRDYAKNSIPIRDAYGNTLEAIGTDNKVETFTNYGLSNDTLNWPLWLALYNDSWVFRRAIDKPAQDEVRAGITLQGEADFTKVYTRMQKFRFELIQLLQWGALFGGSIACLLFDNVADKDYAYPLSVDRVRKAKAMRMYVVDRWYGVAPSDDTVTDMASLDFGKPMYYDVTMADGHTIRFHYSYVLRYEHRTAPKLVKNGLLQGWGYAEGSHILNELSRDDKLKASIQSLIDKSLIEVIKMSGMRGVFMGADADNEQQLRKRLEMVNWGRTFNSLTFLDKEDEYSMNSFTGLSGLSDLLDKNMWLVGAALEMQGVLFGDMKQGIGSDDQALERYDETINNRCENYVRPVYSKLLAIFFAMENIKVPVEYTFNSLLMTKHKEEHVAALKTFTDLCSQLLTDGVITVSQYAKALKIYSTNDIVDFNFDDKTLKQLEERENEEAEDFDVGAYEKSEGKQKQ